MRPACEVSVWTLVGLLVDSYLKYSLVWGLPSLQNAKNEIAVANAVQHGSETFRKPGVQKVVIAKASMKEQAIYIVRGVRCLLFTEG